MNALILTLPKSWQPYAKSIVGFVGIALTVVSGTVQAVPMWVTILLGVLSFGGVFSTPAPGYVAPSDQPPVEVDPVVGPFPGDPQE